DYYCQTWDTDIVLF
nr:immunoglobulin light chain junction region [Macaca mulatta]MOV65863.1 immunoglobulin light chain junction region [Macaca mulatta]MOV66056.1 immunoglobulin light chain junction region [Macaca mulatta]MOV66444.1 immunoglobulin light chain junction region [Macaca mulatta]MOV66593.1 immunoglobulin light chain junction region [Macaca mulatta]